MTCIRRWTPPQLKAEFVRELTRLNWCSIATERLPVPIREQPLVAFLCAFSTDSANDASAFIVACCRRDINYHGVSGAGIVLPTQAGPRLK